jgi:hypothetical protein
MNNPPTIGNLKANIRQGIAAILVIMFKRLLTSL